MVNNTTTKHITNNNLKTTIMENLVLKPMDVQENSFTFMQEGKPIIVIDSKGFNYKGELIEDAGEVYNLFKSFFQQSLINENIQSTELIKQWNANPSNYGVYDILGGLKHIGTEEALKLHQYIIDSEEYDINNIIRMVNRTFKNK